jgi:hypothetical protein
MHVDSASVARATRVVNKRSEPKESQRSAGAEGERMAEPGGQPHAPRLILHCAGSSVEHLQGSAWHTDWRTRDVAALGLLLGTGAAGALATGGQRQVPLTWKLPLGRMGPTAAPPRAPTAAPARSGTLLRAQVVVRAHGE